MKTASCLVNQENTQCWNCRPPLVMLCYFFGVLTHHICCSYSQSQLLMNYRLHLEERFFLLSLFVSLCIFLLLNSLICVKVSEQIKFVLIWQDDTGLLFQSVVPSHMERVLTRHKCRDGRNWTSQQTFHVSMRRKYQFIIWLMLLTKRENNHQMTKVLISRSCLLYLCLTSSASLRVSENHQSLKTHPPPAEQLQLHSSCMRGPLLAERSSDTFTCVCRQTEVNSNPSLTWAQTLYRSATDTNNWLIFIIHIHNQNFIHTASLQSSSQRKTRKLNIRDKKQMSTS